MHHFAFKASAFWACFEVDLGVLKDEDCPSAVCKVQVYLWTLEQKLLEGVPSSIHYPSGAPLWAQQELELRIERPRQSLELRLEPSRREVAPGGDVDVEVRLKQSRQAQTEVALLVVDKAAASNGVGRPLEAWLDLQPLELLEPLDAMEPRQAASGQWRLASSLDGLASGRSLTRATERIRRSFKENPWVPRSSPRSLSRVCHVYSSYMFILLHLHMYFVYKRYVII